MTPSSGRTALIAGAAGFIGSHLADALVAEGYRIIGVDNLVTGSRRNIAHLEATPQFAFIEADVREPLDRRFLQAEKIDAVYNLASPASPRHYQKDPVATLLTNFLGTKNLLDLALAEDADFFQASTSEVYGDPLVHPQPETYWGNTNPIGIRACYDEGKRVAETLCFDYLRQRGAKVRVARIFNTYGPRMASDDGRVVSNFIVQALTGKPVTLYGDGRQTRSFQYVDDLVAGIRAVMRQADPGPFNLGNPEEFTVRELAEMVIALTGSAAMIETAPLPADDPARRKPDISRAQALGWEPKVRLKDGLAETIAAFRAELD